MIERTVRQQPGFTLIEMVVIVLILGVLIAFATPKFTNAMREYRVSMASRQLTDLIQRAKTQAVSDNRKVVVRVDTAGNRAGLEAMFDTSVPSEFATGLAYRQVLAAVFPRHDLLAWAAGCTRDDHGDFDRRSRAYRHVVVPR